MASSMLLQNLRRVLLSEGQLGADILTHFRALPVSSTHQVQLRSRQSAQCYSTSVGPYYVLLPEIPPDTPETNPIMRIDEYPRFQDITPSKAITGCAKLAIEFDVKVGKHVEKLKEVAKKKTFEDVFDNMERLTVPLDYAWRTAKHLSYTCGSAGYREAFSRIHRQVERSKNERWVNQALYQAVKEIKQREFLTENQERLVDMYLLEARLNGVELTGTNSKQFVQLLGRLVEERNHFRNRVMLSHSLFSHTIGDMSEIAEIPRSLLREIAVDKSNPERGPWRVTLNQNVYDIFMQYCSRRMARWNVWQAFNNRASVNQVDQNLSNHVVIENIRDHRRDIAKLLGYENFVEMSMETKMAGSLDSVVAMLSELRNKFYDAAGDEITSLQEFARSEGFGEKLQMWDVPYWRRRQRVHLHNLDSANLSQSLPYPVVMDYLFKLCGTLFGIKIKDCTGEVNIWHPSVNFYKVYDSEDGHEISAFYVDPYARPAEKMYGVWMESGRERSQIMNTLPFSYLNLSLSAPLGSEPSLMSIEQVFSLFHEFGHGLQQMFTTVPYSEISGQRNIEWDSLQTCAKVLSLFAQHPKILAEMSAASGRPLTPETIDKVTAARRHMSRYDMMRQLYYSAFDLEMYISSEGWQKVMPRIWKQYVPIPISDEDNHPCSLTAIFSDQYPAAYYSIKWAEMIAADLFQAFEDVGFDDRVALAKVGRKFRDTYLTLGGGVSAEEVFRRFRGRDPSREALIARYTDRKLYSTNVQGSV